MQTPTHELVTTDCRANPASLWDLSNRFVTAIRLTAVPPAGIASSLSNYSVGSSITVSHRL